MLLYLININTEHLNINFLLKNYLYFNNYIFENLTYIIMTSIHHVIFSKKLKNTYKNILITLILDKISTLTYKEVFLYIPNTYLMTLKAYKFIYKSRSFITKGLISFSLYDTFHIYLSS